MYRKIINYFQNTKRIYIYIPHYDMVLMDLTLMLQH